ncbi:MAG: putative DNA binding domain-containing protein [Thaumarchaeota archaeon]|nr:putative DNA binding domain-containing protein [Nitrososphaerota archaeon]
MSISAEELEKLINEFEGQVVDCKSHGILSHVGDLAELMVAFGNNKFVCSDHGGRIIIGVDNQKNVESFEAKQGHEELIMNVARDKCYPSMHPIFEVINYEGQNIYMITIPKMENVPYQLITKSGKTFRIRIGSTIREPTSIELEKLFDKGIPSSNDLLAEIANSFPQIFDPVMYITIIPIDLNSKLLTFDVNTVSYLRSNQPRHANTGETKVRQNEFHFVGTDATESRYGIINEKGAYSFREKLKEEKKLIHIGRQCVILLSTIKFAQSLYRKFGYNQRIFVRCRYGRVEGYHLGTSEPWEDYFDFGGLIAQKSDIIIERTVSLDVLNRNNLVSSILEELARACNGVINSGSFNEFVDDMSEKYS